MGFSGVSFMQLLILLVVVAIVFGTKRLRSIGEDLGAAVRSFRKSVRDHEDNDGQPKEKITSTK